MSNDSPKRPRFDPKKHTLPDLFELERKHGVGISVEVLGPNSQSLGQRAKALASGEYKRVYRQCLVAVYTIGGLISVFIAIYAISFRDINPWLVWPCVAIQPRLCRPLFRRFARRVAASRVGLTEPQIAVMDDLGRF